MRPNDRLNYHGQIHRLYADEKDANGNIIKRVFKRYHDNKRITFEKDSDVELYDLDYPKKIFFYKLKNIQ